MADVTKLQAGDGVDDVTDGVVLALGAAKFTENGKRGGLTWPNATYGIAATTAVCC